MTNLANSTQREIKVKLQKLGTVASFKYLETVQSFQMTDKNRRFSQDLHKPLQLLQSESQLEETTPYLLDQKRN